MASKYSVMYPYVSSASVAILMDGTAKNMRDLRKLFVGRVGGSPCVCVMSRVSPGWPCAASASASSSSKNSDEYPTRATQTLQSGKLPLVPCCARATLVCAQATLLCLSGEGAKDVFADAGNNTLNDSDVHIKPKVTKKLSLGIVVKNRG